MDGKAKFKLTAVGLNQPETLMINATPAEDGGDFLMDDIAGTAADFSVDFSDPDGDTTYEGLLEVDIDQDEIGEATNTIKLTLNADTASPVTYQLGTPTEGKIKIFDDDAPELKITAVNSVVNEADGAIANFKVSANVSPNEEITVHYNLS